MEETVLIGGGSGLVGNRLTRLLREKGYGVAWLSRSASHKTSFRTYQWNIQTGKIAPEAIKQADHIINLAGTSIADKSWSEERKAEIINSRVDSTRLLHLTVKQVPNKVKSFISASGSGFYGHRGDEILLEEQPPARNFLGDCCQRWEETAGSFQELGIRTVMLRTGLVLSTEGGALPRLVRPIQAGLGAPLGNGSQWVSWIHLDDLCRMYIHAIEHSGMNGTYNAASPHPVSNTVLTRTLASVLNKPLWLPNVPAFAIKVLMGSRAGLVLDSMRLSTRKVLLEGFQFHHSGLREALEDLYDINVS